MYDIKVLELTREKFSPYGQVVEVPASGQPTIEVETVKFWKQQAIYSTGEKTEVGVLMVKQQEMIFEELENHFKTPTILLCLDGDFILPVAPPSDDLPSPSEVVAFRVPKNQMVIMAEKCWHGVAYPADKEEITLLVIFRENSLDDDTVFEPLDDKCKVVSN
jgi:ureidoglycolate hydrolase